MRKYNIWMWNYKWNVQYFLLSHHVFLFYPAYYCSVSAWGNKLRRDVLRATVVLQLLKGPWRIAFIKTHIQPPSGGVNRESLREEGVEPSLGTCLSRSSLALVWPWWQITEAGGPLRTPVSPSEDADDQWPPSSGMHRGRGTDAFNLVFSHWSCEGEMDVLL